MIRWYLPSLVHVEVNFHTFISLLREELRSWCWGHDLPKRKRICGLQLHCFDKLRRINPFKMPQCMICPLWVWLVMLLIRDFLNASVVYDHVVSNLRRFGGNSKARNVPWNHRMSFASEWVCQSASWLERRILFDSLKWLKNILCKKMMIWPYGRLQRFNSQF